MRGASAAGRRSTDAGLACLQRSIARPPATAFEFRTGAEPVSNRAEVPAPARPRQPEAAPLAGR